MTDLLGPGAFGAARATTVRPTLSPGNAGGDPDTWAQDCTSPTANDGTENRAGLFNMLLAQLRHAIRKSSVTANNTDDDMLTRAVRSQALNYVATVGGTANALTVTLDPAPAAVTELVGVPLRLRMALANTGAVTINPNGVGAVSLLGPGGSVIPAFAWAAGDVLEVLYDGTNFRVVSGLAQQRTRFKNLIDNPLFSIYQRKATPYNGDTLAAGAYGLDRWKGGASGCTFTRAGVTLTISAGTLVHLVEGSGGPFSVGDNWGQVTLSWGGTAQARINGGAYGPSPMTISIANNTKIALEWSTGTLSSPQLEFGPRATTFEARTFSEEVNVCRRFCEVISQDQLFVAAAAGHYIQQSSPLVPKPATPTATMFSAGGSTNAASATAASTSQFSVTLTLTSSAAGACQITNRIWILDAEPQ